RPDAGGRAALRAGARARRRHGRDARHGAARRRASAGTPGAVDGARRLCARAGAPARGERGRARPAGLAPEESDVTVRRWLLLAAAGVCLALATIAALAAHDAGAWGSSLRAGDIALSEGGTPSWRPQELAPLGLARRLLGVDDDLAFRRALALFRRARTGIPS